MPSRILFVEDEALVAMDLARRIESLGYEVVGTADNRDDAINLAEETTPDLVLMDVNITGSVDGIEASKDLLKRWDLPIVFLTAFGDEATVNRAKEVTPYGYLLKPFDERTLSTTLEVTLHRHQADRQMRLLSTAVNTATNGIIVVDALHPTRPITYCNQAYMAMIGYSETEVLGRSACFLASTEGQDDVVAQLRNALRQNAALDVVVTAQRKDGTQFWSAISISPVADITGLITNLLIFHTDITARRHAEGAMIEAQKLEVVGRLTAGVAHDFNNVLAAIQAFTEFAQEDLDPGDERREDLEEVIDASNRGAAITRQLLSFVHRGGGAPRHVDVNKVVQRASKMLRRLVGATVQVDIRPSAQPLVVLTDPIGIEQVLLNLAANARDAMPDGGTFTLALSYQEGERSQHLARLEARDSGSGMSAETSARIFEPFFTTKPRGTGTGLGLASIKAVVDRLAGHIRVESALGQGTAFVIDLPLSGGVDWEEESSLETTDLGDAHGATVLVAEDNPALREASCRALAQVGFNVVAAADGKQAIAQLDKLGPNVALIVSDIVLPHHDGLEVVAHAKTTAPQAPALFLTGYLDIQHGVGTDALAVLWKPFPMTSLMRRALEAVSTKNDEGHDAAKLQANQAAAASDNKPTGETAPPPSSLRQEATGILLAEDEHDLRAALRRTLEKTGYQVTAVAGGDAAITELRKREYALVITDINLPGPDGIAVLRTVQAECPHTPVLLITGAPSVETARVALYDKAAGYLVKPFGLDDFESEIERIMTEVEVAKLRRYLLATRYGGDELIDDLATTSKRFDDALESLYMVFQPIVRAHDCSLYAYETLMRNRSKTLGNPVKVLAAAEVLGRIEDLGRVVRERVADVLDRHPEQSLPIFVNIHPNEFKSKLLCADDDPLRRYSSRVVFEVTERATLTQDDKLTKELETIRSCGYRVALDDLGEGYAGLSWLVKLRPEVAKLDMSLVRQVHESKLKQEIVRSLVAVCRRSNITLVAEGVEDVYEARALTDLGCDLLQGYCFARPGPPFPTVAKNHHA